MGTIYRRGVVHIYKPSPQRSIKTCSQKKTTRTLIQAKGMAHASQMEQVSEF